MEPQSIDRDGLALLAGGHPRTARAVLETAGLVGSQNEQAASAMAHALNAIAYQAEAGEHRLPPGAGVGDRLAWTVEAVRRGETSVNLVRDAAIVAGENWIEARAMGWVDAISQAGADPVEVWATIAVAGILADESDPVRSAQEALHSLGDRANLTAIDVTHLADDGPSEEVLPRLQRESLDRLIHVFVHRRNLTGLAHAAIARLDLEDPNLPISDPDARAAETAYADGLEQALAGRPGGMVLGGFDPTDAALALRDMIPAAPEGDPRATGESFAAYLRHHRQTAVADLASGADPSEVLQQVLLAEIDIPDQPDWFWTMVVEKLLETCDTADGPAMAATRQLLDALITRGTGEDVRSVTLHAFLGLLLGDRLDGLSSLLYARALGLDDTDLEWLGELRDRFAPGGPLTGVMATPEFSSSVEAAWPASLGGEVTSVQKIADGILAHPRATAIDAVEAHLLLAECRYRDAHGSPRALYAYNNALRELADLRPYLDRYDDRAAANRLCRAILSRALPIATRTGRVGDVITMMQRPKVQGLRMQFEGVSQRASSHATDYGAALPTGFALERQDVAPPLLFAGLAAIPVDPTIPDRYLQPWNAEIYDALLVDQMQSVEAGPSETTTSIGSTALPRDPVAVEPLRERLKEDDVFLEYMVLPTDIYVVVITKQRSQIVRIPLDRPLDRIAHAAWEEMSAPPADPSNWKSDRDLPSCVELHGCVITPLIHFLSGAQRLIIATDGPLNRIPMDGLPHGKQFLGDVFDVVQVPSAAVWLKSLERVVDPSAFVASAVGLMGTDPEWRNAAGALEGLMARFPDAEFYGGEHSLTAEQAIPLASEAPVLHISAPAFTDPDMPAMSPVFLGSGPAQPECVLPLGRFADRTFGLGLVVLDGLTSEPSLHDHEADSPIAALLASATRVVIATSWRGDPGVSADLFATLHEQLAREGAARSLRRAKRRIRQHQATSHPYYWAAAILGGDADWSYASLPAARP